MTTKKKPSSVIRFTRRQMFLRTFPRAKIYAAIDVMLCFPSVKSVTMFTENPAGFRVRATRISEGDYRLNVGRPNFRERLHLKRSKKDPDCSPLVHTEFVKNFFKNKKGSR